MASTLAALNPPTDVEREQMHRLYVEGGKEKQLAPHVVYGDTTCPHAGCQQALHAIDFRLEDHGRAVHDPLVRAGGMTRVLPVAVRRAQVGFTSPSAASGRSARKKRLPCRNCRKPGLPLQRYCESGSGVS